MRIVPLAWYREAWEEQQQTHGLDPWQYGLTVQNRTTLETLANFSFKLGLVKRAWPIDEIFLDVSGGRKRGGFQI